MRNVADSNKSITDRFNRGKAFRQAYEPILRERYTPF